MSTPATFFFNNKPIASKHYDGYVSETLYDLVVFLRRDGYDTVKRVFEAVPEFFTFDSSILEAEEYLRPGEDVLVGYGYIRSRGYHSIEGSLYDYYVYDDGDIVVMDADGGKVASINWTDEDVYSKVSQIILMVDGDEGSSRRALLGDSAAVANDAIRAGVPVADIIA